MYMRLTPREKEMADMFEQMSKEEQEIMIEFAKRLRTEDPEKLKKEINQRLKIDDDILVTILLPFERGAIFSQRAVLILRLFANYKIKPKLHIL